jgi:hypothetical protein
MRKKYAFLFFALTCSFFLIISAKSFAQEIKKQKHRTGSIYFSWGYNEDNYTKSTVHVKQDAFGNNYDLVHVTAQDHQGWNDGVLHKQLSIPQYNWRIGYYFNDKQDLGIEMNFDHTKYIISDNQNIHLTGTLNHRTVDTTIFFSQAQGFYYFLNNGANFLLFNLVKRINLYHTANNYLHIDAVGKAGIGPVVPHVQNSFFGVPNEQHFQLGGWNTGVEAVLRATILKYGFLEMSQKLDYARYSGLKLAGSGTGKQNFGTYETILSAGFILPTTKHNPSFEGKAKDDGKGDK